MKALVFEGSGSSGTGLERVIADAVCDCAGPLLAAALERKATASLALTGGNTPALYLPALFSLPLAWERMVLTLADDRLVPPDHADSNAGLVLKHQAGSRAGAAMFVPLATRYEDAVGAAAEAGEAIKLRVSWPLDLVILGMGPDGHIASLFPALKPDLEAPQLCIGVAVPPTPLRHPRVSLSLTALASAHAVLLVLQGREKMMALEYAAATPGAPLRALIERLGDRLTVIAIRE